MFSVPKILKKHKYQMPRKQKFIYRKNHWLKLFQKIFGAKLYYKLSLETNEWYLSWWCNIKLVCPLEMWPKALFPWIEVVTTRVLCLTWDSLLVSYLMFLIPRCRKNQPAVFWDFADCFDTYGEKWWTSRWAPIADICLLNGGGFLIHIFLSVTAKSQPRKNPVKLFTIYTKMKSGRTMPMKILQFLILRIFFSLC